MDLKIRFKASSIIILLLIGLGYVFNQAEPALADKPEVPATEINEPIIVTIVLQRAYLDGEMSEEKIQESIWAMEDFWVKYEEWQLIEMDQSQAVFRQEIDDISPLLKANGYFGLSDDGILTIFNGRPGADNIIQSFFQIDLGRLESIKRDQLQKGIPIKNKQCYQKVLETFTPYTMKEKK
jgi:forespore regulator of the sigma-K checkpoint